VKRTIALTAPARARLLSPPRESEFSFPTLRRPKYLPRRGVQEFRVWMLNAQVSQEFAGEGCG